MVSGSTSVIMRRPASAAGAADPAGALVVVISVRPPFVLPSSAEASGLFDQVLRHVQPLDLVRPLVDLGALGVTHEALDRIVAAVARSAIDLHRVGGDAH